MTSEHTIVGLLGAVGLVLQIIAGGMAISDRFRANSRDFLATQKRAGRAAGLLACSLVIGSGFLVYWFMSPEAAAASAKAAPCVTTQQTGDATTNGAQSPANTGNGNPTTYGAPAEPPKAQPKPKE